MQDDVYDIGQTYCFDVKYIIQHILEPLSSMINAVVSPEEIIRDVVDNLPIVPVDNICDWVEEASDFDTLLDAYHYVENEIWSMFKHMPFYSPLYYNLTGSKTSCIMEAIVIERGILIVKVAEIF